MVRSSPRAGKCSREGALAASSTALAAALALVLPFAGCRPRAAGPALHRLTSDPTIEVGCLESPREDDPRAALAAGRALPPLRLAIASSSWIRRDDGLGIPGIEGPVWLAVLPAPVAPRAERGEGMAVRQGGGVLPRFKGRAGEGFSWLHDGRHLVLVPPARSAAAPPAPGEGAGGAGPPGACEVIYPVDPSFVADPFRDRRVAAAGEGAATGGAGRFRVGDTTFDGVALEVPGEVQWALDADPGKGPAVLRFGVAVETGGLVLEDGVLRNRADPAGDLEVSVMRDGHTLGRWTVAAAGGDADGASRETVRPVRLELPPADPAEGTLAIRVRRAGAAGGAAGESPPAPVRAWLVDPRIEGSAPAARGARRGVILIVLDTLRRDRVGCYGSRRPTSPHVDAWTRGGMRFARASANANWTLPSHASLFLSRLPQEHRVWTLQDTLRRGSPTLARILRRQGRVTAAITDGGLLRASFGLDQGFGEYHDRRRGAAGIFEAARTWLETIGGAPFFLFLHTYEVHAPYEATEEVLHAVEPGYQGPTSGLQVYEAVLGKTGGPAGVMEMVRLAQQGELRADRLDAGRLAQLDTLYDGGVRTADEALGGFLASLERLGLDEHVLVILTSDHGESLGEHHLLGHGGGYFEPEIAIPLILRGPGVAAGRAREERVSLLDVAPTVLDWWGLPAEPRHDGTSLLRALPPERPVIAAGYRRRARLLEFTVLQGPWKLVRTHRQPLPRPPLLFDLDTDPSETVDRSGDAPEERDRLEAIFEERRPPPGASHDRAARERPTIEEQDDLRALGYGGGGGAGR